MNNSSDEQATTTMDKAADTTRPLLWLKIINPASRIFEVESVSYPNEPLHFKYNLDINYIPISDKEKLWDTLNDMRNNSLKNQPQQNLTIFKHIIYRIAVELYNTILNNGIENSAHKLLSTPELAFQLLLLAKQNNNIELGLHLLEIIPDFDDHIETKSIVSLKLKPVNSTKNSDDITHPAKYEKKFKLSTLLHKASEIGWHDMTKSLLSRYKLNSTDHEGRTPLHLAAKSGDLKTVRLLTKRLKRGLKKSNFNINNLECIINSRDHYGRTPLMFSAMNRTIQHFKVTEYLIKQGANIHIKDEKNFSALDYAASFSNQPEVVKLLIDNGATYSAGFMGFDTSALFLEAYTRGWIEPENAKEIFSLTLKIAPNFNPYLAQAFDACHKGNIDAVKELLKMIDNINEQSENGDTLLHQAAFSGQHEIIELLLKNGAILSIKSYDNTTPLMAAVNEKTSPKTINLLLKNDGNVLAVNKVGETALSIAIRKQLPDLFDALIPHFNSEQLTKVNIVGETYLHLAIKNKNIYALQKILSHTKYDCLSITKYGLSLLDYCNFYDEKALNILLPDTDVSTHLKNIINTNFISRAKEHIRTINSILENGILSAQTANNMGIKITASADKKLSDKVYYNIIKTEKGLAKSLDEPCCGSLSVVMERENDIIRLNDDSFTTTVSVDDSNKKALLKNFKSYYNSSEKSNLFELTRRQNISFLTVVSVKNIKDAIDNDSESYESSTSYSIPPAVIDLIILPEYLRPFRHELNSKHCKLVFLDEQKQGNSDEKIIYIDFVPSKIIKANYQISDGTRTDVYVCAPNYNCASLVNYFNKNKPIATHIVRCESPGIEYRNLASSKHAFFPSNNDKDSNINTDDLEAMLNNIRIPKHNP